MNRTVSKLTHAAVCTVVAGALLATGCRTPSGYSEYRHEYDGATGARTVESRYEMKYRAGHVPPPPPPPVVVHESTQPVGAQTGEWQFVSPGEMIVDPR